ncbi:MAG: Response regulator of zinc sigma-54-dependent two-component system [Acidobacteria bacterium]|nr:Response regulator of zinc sigma-54-dependent two-component system [Acidobacteriota bacterium]
MVMRGPARGRDAIVPSPAAFEWDRAPIATLRHATLPWREELAASPLGSTKLGARDALSLLAQFAAHQALLQFASVANDGFDAAEWAVVQKRGSDCRLIRVAARACDIDTAPPPLTVAQQFAEAIDAPPLDVLEQSWARAETIYLEALRTLALDSAADLRWTRAAAFGELLAPGVEALRMLLASRSGRFSSSDPAVGEALEASGSSVLRLGGSGLPSRYGAIEPLRNLAGNLDRLPESEIAERVAERLRREPAIVLVAPRATFDPPSWHVVELLANLDAAVLIFTEGAPPLPESRFFLAAPTLALRRELDERLGALPAARRRAFLHEIDPLAFDKHGELPVDELLVAEPLRSYIGALALLGRRMPRPLARAFLQRFFFEQPLETLAIEGVTVVDDDAIVFAGEGIREQAARAIPAASRPALCRVAAEVAEPEQAAALLIEAGELDRASRLLERIDDLLPVLRHAPPALFAAHPSLASRYAAALVDAGRYRDARAIAPLLADDDRELVLARCERRTGDYGPALARVERLQGAEAVILRAELLSITGRGGEAWQLLEACDRDDPRVSYTLAVLALDRGISLDVDLPPYLEARLATYREPRLEHVERALQHARTAIERADALLDRVFVLFSLGRWPEARAAAMEALAEIDDTQGDRAAGGFLFFLAYLAADDGQWAHAEQRLARLRHFYANRRDELRLAELDLLAAHLDFSRGRFDSAKRLATKVVALPLHAQIVEAAALIVDEIACIEGTSLPPTSLPLRSRGRSGNAELDARRAALRTYHDGPLPEAHSRSEKLKLFRRALARGLPLANELARELGIEVELHAAGDGELRVVRLFATAGFPFTLHDLPGLRWRLVTRNRLGHWHELGSEPPLAAAALDELAAGAGRSDWLPLGEHELLFVEGSSRWSLESREAVAAIVRTKAENHRLRRLVEQEESIAPKIEATAIDGIVGESQPMRDLFAMIPRLAKRDVTVCILGESGTGKELVARAMHRHSPRRAKTFTPVNCAALPENLIESELFGHVRGAFTGADRDRPGLIETSDGGTLFLDEIGEMPLAAQAKLLRFLQEGEFRRVGETVNRTADVRIVSATNRKLEGAVEEGRFREDLYYRIRGVDVILPPLRDRAADVPLLASHFLAAERAKHRGGVAKLSPEVESIFRMYGWPGNVRELQNTIRAAHAMAGEAKQIEIAHLPERLRSSAGPRRRTSSYQDEVARFRRELIERSLAQARGNQNQAAALLNISRQALAYQIRELGILVGKTSRNPANM